MRGCKTGIIVVFGILLALPGFQQATGVLHKARLNGAVSEVKRPALSWKTWFSGEFQPAFAAWLESGLGLREQMIIHDNQVNLSLFGETANMTHDAPIVGRDGMLYMRDYVSAANRRPRGRLRDPEDFARTLRKLQDRLQARHIGFVFVLAPSKVEIYPEFVPPEYFSARRAVEPGDYDRLVPCLDSAGVRYVDGRRVLAEERQRSGRLVFPPTGVHWNHYGASLVVREIIRLAEQGAGRELPGFAVTGVTEDFKLRKDEGETDIADLLNVAYYPKNRKPLPRPVLENGAWSGARKPRYVLVGDSFAFQIRALLEKQGLFESLDLFYYFNKWHHHPGGQIEPMDKNRMDWERDVFSKDVIIVECNEVQLYLSGHGFPARALSALEAEK